MNRLKYHDLWQGLDAVQSQSLGQLAVDCRREIIGDWIVPQYHPTKGRSSNAVGGPAVGSNLTAEVVARGWDDAEKSRSLSEGIIGIIITREDWGIWVNE